MSGQPLFCFISDNSSECFLIDYGTDKQSWSAGNLNKVDGLMMFTKVCLFQIKLIVVTMRKDYTYMIGKTYAVVVWE